MDEGEPDVGGWDEDEWDEDELEGSSDDGWKGPSEGEYGGGPRAGETFGGGWPGGDPPGYGTGGFGKAENFAKHVDEELELTGKTSAKRWSASRASVTTASWETTGGAGKDETGEPRQLESGK